MVPSFGEPDHHPFSFFSCESNRYQNLRPPSFSKSSRCSPVVRLGDRQSDSPYGLHSPAPVVFDGHKYRRSYPSPSRPTRLGPPSFINHPFSVPSPSESELLAAPVKKPTRLAPVFLDKPKCEAVTEPRGYPSVKPSTLHSVASPSLGLRRAPSFSDPASKASHSRSSSVYEDDGATGPTVSSAFNPYWQRVDVSFSNEIGAS